MRNKVLKLTKFSQVEVGLHEISERKFGFLICIESINQSLDCN